MTLWLALMQRSKEPREEVRPWTIIAAKSGHLMLITPERVFYAGLLGRPRERCSGAIHVYVAIEGGLRLAVAGGGESYGELAVVPPDVRHTIASDHRSVICVLIEPETVRAGAFDELAQLLSGAGRPLFAERIRAAYRQLQHQPCGDAIASAAFDLMCFGALAAAAAARSARGAGDRADRPVLRRAGDGGQLR